MQGKTVLVTGANGGIGFATATSLAKMGAHVLMVARNREKGESAQAEVKRISENDAVDLLVADLSLMESVRGLGETVNARYERLDVLINNAAFIPPKRTLTSEGLETQFATNHLAPFLLTYLLLPKLIDSGTAAKRSRIINLSSFVHIFGTVDFDHLQNDRRYHTFWFPVRGWQAYSNTKLMNLLFTYELARRLKDQPVTANAVHPGTPTTGLTRTLPPFMAWVFKTSLPKNTTGAETPVYLASSPQVEGRSGVYFAASRPSQSSRASHDAEAARRLWDVSAEMTGIDGGIPLFNAS